ncbi:hypothetical protein TKK_0004657 [Trichogramma kaykai]
MSDQMNNSTTQSIADYLSQLLKDRKQLVAFPSVFIHVERLLDEDTVLDRFPSLRTYISALQQQMRGANVEVRRRRKK